MSARFSHLPAAFFALMIGTGCATTAPAEQPAAPPPSATPASKSIDPSVLIDNDVKRIEEIARLDHQNQVQAGKVRTLEKTVTDLQAQLSAALERGTKPAAESTSPAPVAAATSEAATTAPAATPAAPPAPSTSASSAEPTEDGTRVRIRLSGELLFVSNSARITRGGRRALAEVAKVLHDTRARRIEVGGHTDSQPTSKKYADNWQLSAERAHRVVAYLAEQGVDPHLLVAIGYADSQPIDKADTAEARSRNRRVEIFVEPLRDQASAQ